MIKNYVGMLWNNSGSVGVYTVWDRSFNEKVDSSRNVMAHGDPRERNWRGNWRMEWVASTLHRASEHSVSSITTADAHTSAASSRLNWRPCLFKWNRPFRRKMKSGFCACAITFQTQSTAGENGRWEDNVKIMWQKKKLGCDFGLVSS